MVAPIQVELPGGLFVGNNIHKQALFAPLTGFLEARIADITTRNQPDLQRATQILGCSVGLGPDRETDPDLALKLCLGDRQFLMQCLARLIDGDGVWIHPECERCRKVFDIRIQRSKVPVKKSEKGYPFVNVHCRGEPLCFRIPTGIDEQSIAEKPTDDAVRSLLGHCFMPKGPDDDVDTIISGLSPEDIKAIDSAFDETAPDVSSSVETLCPECGFEQVVRIRIDHPPDIRIGHLYQDIHTLAQSYGWNESEILSLPSGRRKMYARLIDQTRGVYA